MSCCILNTRRSPRITSSHGLVFRGLPLPLCPSPTTSLPFITQLFFVLFSTYSNHLCMQFLILPNPRRYLNSSEDFVPFLCHITHPLLLSCHFYPHLSTPLLSLPRSHYHGEQHSWHMLYLSLPIVHRQKFPKFLPAAMLYSTPAAALIISLKQQHLSTTSKDLLLTKDSAGLISPVHFLHSTYPSCCCTSLMHAMFTINTEDGVATNPFLTYRVWPSI